MNVVFAGYRRWAHDLFRDVLRKRKARSWRLVRVLTVRDPEAPFRGLGAPTRVCDPKQLNSPGTVRWLEAARPDCILFYGWSWMIREPVLNTAPCIVLHPSPLPRYRGGSPIQNQILAGETRSAVTLFLAGPGLDDGDILAQKPISLEGSLDGIFGRIVRAGSDLTAKLLDDWTRGKVRRIPQDPRKATACRRRRPEDSEITPEELRSKSALYLYDKIRCLQDPYPNAYLRGKDGKKVYLTGARLEK